MDVRFLRELSEAYVIDIEGTVSEDQIFNEIYDMVKYIRIVDPELHDELYEVEKVRQSQILRKYIDLVFENETEVLIEVWEIYAGIAAMAAMYATRKQISKGVFKVLSVIGKRFNELGNFLAKQGKYLKIRYSIIQENFQKCYIRCGINDPKQISSLAYLNIKEGSTFGTKLSATQAECLRNCYLENLVEIINLHMECYFACLKRTGNFAAMRDTDSDDIMRMIASTKVGAVCGQYHQLATESLDDFYKTLDLIYASPQYDDRKLEWIQKLRQKIYATRQMISKIDDRSLQRYGDNNIPRVQPTLNYQNKQHH